MFKTLRLGHLIKLCGPYRILSPMVIIKGLNGFLGIGSLTAEMVEGLPSPPTFSYQLKHIHKCIFFVHLLVWNFLCFLSSNITALT